MGPGVTGRGLDMKWYASRQESESGIMEAAERREVWLRGNVRPVAGLALITIVVATASGLGFAAAGLVPTAWLVAVIAVAVLAGSAVVARAAAAPRLERDGDRLAIRLAPGRVERVPLEVVECVFRGSEILPDPRRTGTAARLRVGTVVVRFAERASEWRTRPAFGPWGTWEDGHAVIDGRWCEPLSRETVQRIASALIEAKRETVAGPAP